jgi:hypothetical protein
MRDLRQQGRLWSQEENGKVTFYLKLKGGGENTGNIGVGSK